MTDPLRQITQYQRELFAYLGEFFERATGEAPSSFSSIDDFSATIRRKANKLAGRAPTAYPWLEEKLRELYSTKAPEAFRLAKQLGGLKLVHGGSSRFLGTQLASTCSSLLYADSVLIPDPVAPWLERDRQEERFRHVLLLQAVHTILHIKPLIDADLPYPAAIVFPSFEKLLEDNDPQTRAGMNQLVVDVLARFVDPGIGSMQDATRFAHQRSTHFGDAIERNRLFIAPGGSIDDSLVISLEKYEEDLKTWRSAEWLANFDELPWPAKVLNGLFERISPQYHVLENAEELNANPLLSVWQQAHYFRLVSQTNSARLEKMGLLDPQTNALVEGLASERLRWLSRVPIDSLIELRQRDENVAFRRRLVTAVSALHQSTLGDINNVAAEVCQEIAHAVAEHNNTLQTIEEKYAQKNQKTIALALAAVSGALLPTLAPFVGTAVPLAAAGKFVWDALEKRSEMQKQRKSLIGVLADIGPFNN